MLTTIRCFIVVAVVLASQITGSGAADAEWDRIVLPRPPQPFRGVAKRTLEGSVAAFTQPVKAPPNAPNILLVLIDDAGFGNPSTFGGPVSTPTLDKLAAEGLRYNRFHVTALCSPNARGVVIGKKPSRGRVRLNFGVDWRLARLQHKLADKRGVHRPDPSSQRL